MSDHRCTPGAKRIDARCTRHTQHYWCDACEGFYGVPHDGLCHTAQQDIYGALSARGQCACRLCERGTARHTDIDAGTGPRRTATDE